MLLCHFDNWLTPNAPNVKLRLCFSHLLPILTLELASAKAAGKQTLV